MKKKSIVTIIGGSGFLGAYLVRRLASIGVRIQIISRSASIKAAPLKVCGSVGQIALIDCAAYDFVNLEKHISRSDYVINLVGILYDRGRQDFGMLHTNVPTKIAEMCTKYKIKKFIHISALGVDNAKTSKYAYSKLEGEISIFSNYPNATILRPSIMFGAEDNFINLFAKLSKFSPFLPLIGGGKTLFQPVFVDDVASAIVKCLNDNEKVTEGKIIELGGPTQYSFKEILEIIISETGRKRLLIPLPFWAAKINAIFLGLLPNPLLTIDQVELLKYNNICESINGLESLGIKPKSLELIVSTYID